MGFRGDPTENCTTLSPVAPTSWRQAESLYKGFRVNHRTAMQWASRQGTETIQ